MENFEIDWEDDAADADMAYLFDKSDEALLKLVARALKRMVDGQQTSWAQKTSIAKLLHLLTRLPESSAEMEVEISLISPRQSFAGVEVHFWLTVRVDGSDITIAYKGHHFDPERGGDTFTVFRWEASPGMQSQWVNNEQQLRMVPGLKSPDKAIFEMACSQEGFTFDVSDTDNDLLDDGDTSAHAFIRLGPELRHAAPESEDVGDHDTERSNADQTGQQDDDSRAPLNISPLCPADGVLLASVGPAKISKASLGQAFGISHCDSCGSDLSAFRFFVDGNAPQGGWGNYCASCAMRRKVPIGRGLGQLYAQQPNGRWHGIAGF